MKKKDNVHLQLSEELVEIDEELGQAMEALSETNQRIDSFLNGEEDVATPTEPAAEIDDKAEEAAVEEVENSDDEHEEANVVSND